MATARALFYGHNADKVSIELAMREDGAAFVRQYEFNGFQNAWSKWIKCPFFHQVDENFIRYNGAVLSLVPGPYRLRLP